MTTQAAALAAHQADADLDVARERLGAALPGEGWLAEYMRAVTPLTDTPVEFSLASGLSALAAALGNSIWYETWGQTVYPHLWAVLVAPSSFWRKSTAINMAERLLREAEDSRVLPGDFSREKLLEELQARPVGLLTQKEFGGFLERLGASYMAGTKEMLTDLYDGPDRYSRALKTRTYTIERPSITLLAATTLDWLESKITEGDLRSGFLARFMFVTAAGKSSPKGLTGGMDGLVRMHLRDQLIALTKLSPGPARLTPQTRDLYDGWLSGWQEEVESVRHASDLTGFAVRLQTYALKLAMSYQASSAIVADKPVDIVEEPAMASAIAYCRHLWANVAALVDEEIAIGRDAKELRRIRHMVGGGTTRSQLLKLSKMPARDFDKYLDTLVQTGEVIRERRYASELGIQRAKDRQLEWIRPGSLSVPDSVPDSVPPLSSPSIESEPSELNGRGPESGSESELEGPDPIINNPSVLSSLSLSISDESGGGTRTREEPRELKASRRRSPKPAAQDAEGIAETSSEPKDEEDPWT